MKKLVVILVMGLFAAQFMGCDQKPGVASESRIDLVARGKYLVTVGGCHDCHSPKVFGPRGEQIPDSTRMLSGHPQDIPIPAVWVPADLERRNIIASANPIFTA